MKNVKNVIITLPVHYEQERIDKKDEHTWKEERRTKEEERRENRY